MRDFIICFISFTLVLGGCHTSRSTAGQTLNTDQLDQLRPVIQARSKLWSDALTSKNVALLGELYDNQAHYLPDAADALHGKSAILTYWQNSLDFLGDLILTMETLEGSRQLLYETGTGSARVMGADGQFFNLPFKYVNVWKRQPDGTYRVVIDTFNDIAPQ